MFIWSAVAHLIALTSPGPDTAIVIRQTSIYGRADGIKASLGIGIGIYIHCILAINGISLIVLANDTYKLVISLIGSLYIIYLGISMLQKKTEANTKNNDEKS
jgi:threonine/homoserine/homoserine lactone efflux protein